MVKIFSREIWSEILYSLKRNTRRTVITSLGIFFGMFFFVLLDGIGTGISNSIADTLSTVSSNLVVIFGGRTTKAYQGYKANRNVVLDYKDFLYMDEHFRTLESVGGYVGINRQSMWSTTPVSCNNKSAKVQAMGITRDYPYEVRPTVALYGRLMSKEELSSGAPVCTIGAEIVKSFFDDPAEAPGHFISMNGMALQIVGVTDALSDGFNLGYDIKRSLEVPVYFAISGDFTRQTSMLGILREGATVKDLQSEVMTYVSRVHHVDPTDKDAIGIMDLESQIAIFDMILNLLRALVWIIGLGTLFTGVISVSNILLVTVKERQREIGVRRAIGAKPADIMLQFMLEAVTMIFIAGLLGLVVGIIFLLGIGAVAESTPDIGSYIARPYPTPGKLVLSLSIMVLAGIAAGLLPVQKALSVKAIDAIRDE